MLLVGLCALALNPVGQMAGCPQAEKYFKMVTDRWRKQGAWSKFILELSAMEKWKTPSVFHPHITFYLFPGKIYIHCIHEICLFFYLLL